MTETAHAKSLIKEKQVRTGLPTLVVLLVLEKGPVTERIFREDWDDMRHSLVMFAHLKRYQKVVLV